MNKLEIFKGAAAFVLRLTQIRPGLIRMEEVVIMS